MNGQDNDLLKRYSAYALLVIAAVILFTKLGSYPLQMQWEPNYGQVMREMVWGEGNIITPTCKVGADEGAAPGTFWSKPIMIFWMAFPFYSVLGDTEWAARLPIALLGLAVVMATFFFMGRIYDRRTAFLAGLLLITSPTYFLISRAFMVDLPFVGFMWLAVLSLLTGEKEGRRLWYNLFYIFMGLSSLAKGITPLVLVGGTIFFYCLVSLDWGLLKRMRIHQGILVYLIIASPWYIYMTSKYGDFYLKKFFWDHHVERALGKLDKPDASFEMFVLYFSIGVLPWITFLPQAITTLIPWSKRLADKRKFELFFLMGFLVAFTFFSVISTKFVHYIFPTVPFAAGLLAVYISRLFDMDGRKEINRITFFVALLVLIIVAPDLLDGKNYRTLFYFITTERLQDWHPRVADPNLFFTIIYVLWGAVLFAGFVLRRFNRYIFGVLLVLSVTYAFYINMRFIPTLTEMFAARSLVHKYLELRSSSDEPLGEFTQTWKSRSIKYYMPFDELKDKYKYRRYRIRNNLESTRSFYNKYKGKRVFIIIEQKQKHFNRINALWQEASGGEQLFKIFDDGVKGEPYRPEFWLVSNIDKQGKSKKLSVGEIREKQREFIRDDPFKPKKTISAVFDEQIELLGFDTIPSKHKAGAPLVITLYFKCLKKTTRDYQVFIHAERKRHYRLRGDHTPVNGSYPTTKWKPGQYIKDSYELDIPPDAKEGKLDIKVGLFKGNHRARCSNVSGRDDQNRLKIGSVGIVR